MAVKTTGEEFKRLYNDDAFWATFGEDAYHEDEEVKVGGVVWGSSSDDFDTSDYNSLPDASVVVVSGGAMIRMDGKPGSCSFEGAFKKWRRGQTSVSVVAVIPRDKVGEFGAALKAIGGKLA